MVSVQLTFCWKERNPPPRLRSVFFWFCAFNTDELSPASAYINAPYGLLVGVVVKESRAGQPPEEKLFIKPVMLLVTPVRVQDAALLRLA